MRKILNKMGVNITLASLKSLDCWFNYPFVLVYKLKSLLVDFSSGGKRLSGFLEWWLLAEWIIRDVVN